MFKGFKDFILKGNVVDMAVGVVVGVAFGNLVKALVEDFVTPLIGAFGGTPDFSSIIFTINNSKFMVGNLMNSILSFLSVSAVIYFFVVMPMNKLTKKMKSGKTEDPTEKACPQCLSVIPAKAKKCKFCASSVK